MYRQEPSGQQGVHGQVETQEQVEERLERLEARLRRLEQRLARIEHLQEEAIPQTE